jgi:hypothetical protein
MFEVKDLSINVHNSKGTGISQRGNCTTCLLTIKRTDQEGGSLQQLKTHLSTMLRVSAVITLAVSLSSCSMFSLLGKSSLADAQFEGVKSGEVFSVLGSIDPRADIASQLLSALGQKDFSLGVVMPVTPIGETTPFFILCTEEFEVKCRNIPLNAKVHFTGSPLGTPGGLLWKPSRLTAGDFDD